MTTIQPPADVLADFIGRYGPPAGELGAVRLVREVLGVAPDPWQEDVLRKYGAGVRRISIRSPHNPGKTACASWCIVHQQLTRFPQKTACTAPTGGQLFDALYSECKMWLKKLPLPLQQLVDIKSDRIELVASREQSFATFKTARPETPEALQGIHAPWVLLVVDEASGVPEAIFEAAGGSMAGDQATTLLLGNPIRTTGIFFNSHHEAKDRWTTFHVCAAAAVPVEKRVEGVWYSERVSKAFVSEMADEYGEDSNAYRIRVLGEFPRADLDTIIPFQLVEAAHEREVTTNSFAPRVWGLDVARFGDDLTALCKRQQNRVLEPIQTWHGLDTMQVVGVIKAEWDATQEMDRPEDIMVDSIGLGAGVSDRLHELGLPARGVNVSESPALNGTRFMNLGTELWYAAKQWFAKLDCWIPKDQKFMAELVAVRYEITDSTGKLKAWPKKKTKKVIRRSPDRADSFILTFASTAATALHGGSRVSWATPLKRAIRGIV